MALTIHQKPLYDLIHAGEKVIFTMKDLYSVTNYVKVKYIARVYVAKLASDLGSSGSLGSSSLVATLKTNPNSSGVGIFDLSPILDNYVTPDYEGGPSFVNSYDYSSYKTANYDVTPHAIHLIDKFAQSQNTTRYFVVVFNMEYATALTNPVVETTNYKTSDIHLMFNGYLDNNDILKEESGNYGYHLNWNRFILSISDAKFLTNAPLKQYIREDDFATIAFFNNLKQGMTPGSFQVGTGSAALQSVEYIKIQYYYNGSTQGSAITNNLTSNGGVYGGQSISDATMKLSYFGVGTANQEGDGSTIPANWDYYTVQAFDDDDEEISYEYEYHKKPDDCKGYETIRLTWLNKFGVWDYYNFTQKSIRTYSKESVSFQGQEGTWNGDKFVITGYQGGRRIFKNKATELLTINTNFITDDEAIWLEELFISNNVFILNKNSSDYANQGIVRKYLEPVMVATEEMKRQTTANDGKKQYTFTISKSKNRRTLRQ